jgi:hypothetical protein
MSQAPEQSDLATAFEAETAALLALDRRIDQLIRERQRLNAAFDAVAAEVDRLLGRGEAPLALLAQIERIDAEISRIEGELEKKLAAAVGRFK